MHIPHIHYYSPLNCAQKIDQYLFQEDEEAFETFAVYCGLALHHAKLYEKIRKSEQKYRVALEVLCYHNSCTELEFEEHKRKNIPDSVPGIDE